MSLRMKGGSMALRMALYLLRFGLLLELMDTQVFLLVMLLLIV